MSDLPTVQAQREADARIADRHGSYLGVWGLAARHIAKEIRAGAPLPDPPHS